MILFICVIIIIIIYRIIWISSNPTSSGSISKKHISNPKNIGDIGETHVARKLNVLPKEYITLNDVLLPTHYGTTQIDHIVVSPYGIFIIETKNYKGWIFGHQDSEEWKQSLVGKNWSSEQHNFRNPIQQNLAHFRTVRDILKEIGDFTIIPIVAFSDSADLKITAPNHTVINWSDLSSIIKSYKTPDISPDNIQHSQYVQKIQHNIDLAISNHRCPKCNGQLIERKGKYGKFLGCSNYPNCRFTHKY